VNAPDTLEGWAPEPQDAAELAAIIDMAFDYRGDVTVVLADGSERIGYLSNRDRESAHPFVQILEPGRDAQVTLRYADIRTIRFTGRDTAAGKSYAAWLERRRTGTVAKEPDPDA
jgi:hypothetical protein